MSFEETGFITAKEMEEQSEAEVLSSEDGENIEIVKDAVIEVSDERGVLIESDADKLPDYAILNPDISMATKLGVAKNVANVLSDVLKTQNLVVYGLNKKDKSKGYVTVEGWNTLGTMLGITPVTEVIEHFESARGRGYGYKARATLYQNVVVENGKIKYGNVLAMAEAIDTSNGYRKDEDAIYSMAQTRALGKAYRSALSWIVKMAGYEPTPAEEMPNFNEKNKN